MRTAALVAGIIALASAAPAAPGATSLADHETLQNSKWHIGCDGNGSPLENGEATNATCHYYEKPAPGAIPIHARSAITPRSAAAGPPSYTSTVPGYKPKYSSWPQGYTPKYPSTSSEYNPYYPPHGTPSYGPPEHTHAPYAPPKYAPSYSPYTPTSQYAEPHYTSYYQKPHTTSHYQKPHTTSNYENPHITPHYEKPYSAYAPPAKPTSPPTCNFVEEECIDCTEYPEACETCNFMFLCGEKKQCTYHGFRETLTMCKEIGEECTWDENDDEYEHPHGEKPEHGEKPAYESPYGQEPEYPSHDEPEYPSHDEPEYPYAEPEYPYGEEPEYPSHDETEYPYAEPEHPHGVNDTEHEYPHGPWGSARHVNHTSA